MPPELEPVEETPYTTAWVILLPRPPRLRKAPECMPTSTPWSRRLGRQLIPRRTGRLFMDPITVQRDVGEWRRDYWEGQHRSQAMMDAGVRRTVVIREPD